MRTLTLLTLASITTSALTYLAMEENAVNGQNQSVKSSDANTPLTDQELHNGLDKLIALLQGYQHTNQIQQRQTKTAQDHLYTQLVAMESRLRTLELAKMEAMGMQKTAVIGSAYEDSLKVSEQEMAEWMDDSLQLGRLDRKSTELATKEAARSLVGVPGVELEKMLCGERFCKANLKYGKGGKEAMLDLFGKPPFMSDGFVTEKRAGEVALYFVHPGESLEEIRHEIAQESLH